MKSSSRWFVYWVTLLVVGGSCVYFKLAQWWYLVNVGVPAGY